MDPCPGWLTGHMILTQWPSSPISIIEADEKFLTSKKNEFSSQGKFGSKGSSIVGREFYPLQDAPTKLDSSLGTMRKLESLFQLGHRSVTRARLDPHTSGLLSRVGMIPIVRMAPIFSCGPVLKASWPHFSLSIHCEPGISHTISRLILNNNPEANSFINLLADEKNKQTWNSMR